MLFVMHSLTHSLATVHQCRDLLRRIWTVYGADQLWRAHRIRFQSLKLKLFVLQLILMFHITHGRQIIIIGKLHTRSATFLLCSLHWQFASFCARQPFGRWSWSVQLFVCSYLRKTQPNTYDSRAIQFLACMDLFGWRSTNTQLNWYNPYILFNCCPFVD